ncbi:MAG: alpha/beta fold hydrolase [bacterium]|nr:alpha/beta fold hydrolase [bacterium]
MDKLHQIPANGQDAELVARVGSGAEGATTILYLHGFGSSQNGEKAEFFRQRAESAGFGFVSLDLQGHGVSGGSMRGLTLSRCLRDVERARRELPSLRQEVSLIGSSMGALVALWHAALARSPASAAVRSLALIAPALGLERTLADALGPKGMADWQRGGVLEVTNELGTFELDWEFVADLERYPSSRLASLHTTPALIFQGKLDDRVSWREVAAFAQATPELTRLELLEDGDHRLIDRMDWIWSETARFLNAATSPASAT